MPVMRSWQCVLLMVLTVLLPLRSALGLTMGMSGAGALIGTAAALTSAHEASCPHHADSKSPVESHHDSAPGSHHGQDRGHLLCDICNVPALDLQTRTSPGAQALPIGVPHRSERFASVVLPIGHKPPIPA